MPLDLHTQFEISKRYHENYMKDLENYLTLKLLGSTRYIIGIKEKRHDPNWQHLQRVEEHDIKELEVLLQKYWKQDDLVAPGAQFAYEFFAENIRLLDKHPEGYCTSSHISIQDREIDINVYKGGNEYKH